MNPIESKIYKCSKCNRLSYDKDTAERCCKENQCDCGKTIKSYYTKCKECVEKLIYEKATKIKYFDYTIEMFYDENSEQFFSNREEMLDYYYDSCIPNWAYGCNEVKFSIDIDVSLESAIVDMYEDFDDIVDEKELRLFIDEWNKKQTAKAFEQNSKIIILFDK